MLIIRRTIRRARALREWAKEHDEHGFDAGLTLLEMAAAIGMIIVISLTIVMAITGLFSSARSSGPIQTLTNVVTAVNGWDNTTAGGQGYLQTCDTLATLLCNVDSPTVLSALQKQAAGVTLETNAAPTSPNQVLIFEALPGLTIVYDNDPVDGGAPNTMAIYSAVDLLVNLPPGTTCVPGTYDATDGNMTPGVWWTRVVVNTSTGVIQYSGYSQSITAMLNNKLVTANPCH